MKDVILAVRRLRKAPWFACAAMLTLGIGIGLNTVAFTTVNALALRLIPVPEAARLVRITPIDSKGRRQNQVSYPDYLDYRQHATTLDGLLGYIPTQLTIRLRTADGREAEPEHMTGYYVAGNYFSVLGITPTLGRTFVLEDENVSARGAVAVISHTLWTRSLDADPQVIGRTLSINGDVVTIVGVGPQEFMGTEPLAPDVWLPLTMRKQRAAGDPDFFHDRNFTWLFMIGRLPQGVTSRDAAERELTTIARGLAQTYPAPVRPTSMTLGPATFFTIVPVVGQVIALVMAILGLVLLVACANVGNLVLARAMTRQREVAVRLALGASRMRLIRQLLTESLLLAAGSAAVGLVLSYWTLLILRAIGMTLLPFRWTRLVIDITPDLHVFAYTGLVAAITGVTFGLAPALQAARLDLVAGLRDEATALGLRWRQSRLRDALVVVQIAVCLMLLVAAGLLTRSLAHAQGLDVGFETHGVISVDADLTQAAVPAKAVAEFTQRLADRARQLPGVRSVSLTTHVPLVTGAKFTEVRLEGQGAGAQAGEETLGSQVLNVSPEYFDTLKLPIVQGRRFSAADSESASVVISDALARRFWPGQDPIGRHITTALSPYPRTVIGVVRDASDVSIYRSQEISMYFPMPADLSQAQPSVRLLARVDGDPRAAIALLRKEARDVDPRAVIEIFTLDDAVSLYTLPSRAAAIAAAVLGAIALIFAMIGVYSVLAYVVTQRRAEIAIRMAMGASVRQVATLILTQGLTLVGIGMTVGMIGALTTSRALRVALFGVSPADPLTFIGVAAILLTIALIACYVPARRASRVDPMVALRIE